MSKESVLVRKLTIFIYSIIFYTALSSQVPSRALISSEQNCETGEVKLELNFFYSINNIEYIRTKWYVNQDTFENKSTSIILNLPIGTHEVEAFFEIGLPNSIALNGIGNRHVVNVGDCCEGYIDASRSVCLSQPIVATVPDGCYDTYTWTVKTPWSDAFIHFNGDLHDHSNSFTYIPPFAGFYEIGVVAGIWQGDFIVPFKLRSIAVEALQCESECDSILERNKELEYDNNLKNEVISYLWHNLDSVYSELDKCKDNLVSISEPKTSFRVYPTLLNQNEIVTIEGEGLFRVFDINGNNHLQGEIRGLKRFVVNEKGILMVWVNGITKKVVIQ